MAQEGGSISGAVLDPSDAVLPGAHVVLRGLESGAFRETASGADGGYSFLNLPAGHYRLEVSYPNGFRAFGQDGLEVAAASLRVDVHMELLPQEDSVIVEVASTSVDASVTQLGETISAKEMTAVPVNGRSFTDLLALQPGVVPASSDSPTLW